MKLLRVWIILASLVILGTPAFGAPIICNTGMSRISVTVNFHADLELAVFVMDMDTGATKHIFHNKKAGHGGTIWNSGSGTTYTEPGFTPKCLKVDARKNERGRVWTSIPWYQPSECELRYEDSLRGDGDFNDVVVEYRVLVPYRPVSGQAGGPISVPPLPPCMERG